MKLKRVHNRSITEADVLAASRLRAVWDERAEKLGVNQQTMADAMDRSQGLVSQYLAGKIALNYRALLKFCEALQIDDPKTIRDDLPEMQGPTPFFMRDPDHVAGTSFAQPQAVRLHRAIVAAAVRLTTYVREVSIEPIPDALYPEVLYEAMRVVARVGVDTIDDSAGMAKAAKEVAAAIRAR